MEPIKFVNGVDESTKVWITAFFEEVRMKRTRRVEIDAQNATDNIDLFIPENYRAHYLKSKLWGKIRRRIRRRDDRICFRCKGKASEVHHRSYAIEVLKGEADEKLVCLCRGCHEFVTYDENRRRTQEEAEAALTAPYSSIELPLQSHEVRTPSGRLKPRSFQFHRPPIWRKMNPTAFEIQSYLTRQFEAFQQWNAHLPPQQEKKRKK